MLATTIPATHIKAKYVKLKYYKESFSREFSKHSSTHSHNNFLINIYFTLHSRHARILYTYVNVQI